MRPHVAACSSGPREMNRWQAIAAWVAILATGATPTRSTQSATEPLFDVWRECARFDRDVVATIQCRLAMAMCARIERQWGMVA